jgi:hypothetical protein
MGKRIFLIGMVLVFTYNCKKETPISFVSETITEADMAMCNHVSCPEVTVSYVEIYGDEFVSEKINSKIKNFVINALHLGDEEKGPSAGTITEAISDFIEMYRTHSAEFPDMSAEYFAEITVQEDYVSEFLISFEMRTYLYTGGAHGYGSTSFMNIDPKSGEEIPTEKLFKNTAAFTTFAEQKFREAFQINPNESINSTGFWFEDDVFWLPGTIGFTEENLILIYNQYDIASYADGPIELEIPLQEAKPYLTF